MIREFLVGTALLGGGGYYVMSGYEGGADIVRTVDATPVDTFKGFDAALSADEPIDLNAGRGDSASDYVRPTVTKSGIEEIDYKVGKDGQDVMRVHVRFQPLDQGKQTKVLMDVDLDPSRLPQGGMMKLGGQTLFKFAVGRLTDALIEQIESGKGVRVNEAFAEMRRQLQADPKYAEWQQRAREREVEVKLRNATKPMLDPDRAKLDPRGAEIVPMDVSR
jgi:hypothetical protein